MQIHSWNIFSNIRWLGIYYFSGLYHKLIDSIQFLRTPNVLAFIAFLFTPRDSVLSPNKSRFKSSISLFRRCCCLVEWVHFSFSRKNVWVCALCMCVARNSERARELFFLILRQAQESIYQLHLYPCSFFKLSSSWIIYGSC